jgi:asparagine synthase (glutamine-hydrolysing)
VCGLTGFIDPRGGRGEELAGFAAVMASTIAHRGPDDSGTWTDTECGVAFGHRRLSIIDLSAHGHQPMHSHSGRFVIVYNGELYNFRDVRQELEAHAVRFSGHSDTEVLLAAIERWGLERAVQRFVGMFAFALWDREERRLHLVRDRLGEKPLYYGWQDRVFLFGSELKALRAHPCCKGVIDREALALYLRYGYVPAPWSIYQGILKLRPGTILTVIPEQIQAANQPVPYWDPRIVAERAPGMPFRGSDEEAISQLEALLSSAVRQQMIADVPLGAFLSGGVDSSAIVALMQRESVRPVRTFTIGFHEDGYNEAEHAKLVAEQLGTDHTELYVTPREAMDVVPLLPAMYDEPFSDSSQIPTHLVSQLARQHVTVSLSGDGGDELFGGYLRYFAGPQLWKYLGSLPRPLRRAAGSAIAAIGPLVWDRLGGVGRRALGDSVFPLHFGNKMTKLAGVMPFEGPERLHRALVTVADDPESVVHVAEPETLFDRPRDWPSLGTFAERMMFVDALTYLPDDILVKVDRASMACSLESRAPFLDHRVVEFAWSLPLHLRIRRGTSKWILRQMLYRHVPRGLIERPKAGFAVPVGSWLRGPLRGWGEELLRPAAIRAAGFLDPVIVERWWREHQTARFDHSLVLWSVLMFQAWLDSEKGSAHSLREVPA